MNSLKLVKLYHEKYHTRSLTINTINHTIYRLYSTMKCHEQPNKQTILHAIEDILSFEYMQSNLTMKDVDEIKEFLKQEFDDIYDNMKYCGWCYELM
jgi:hypothetical protein